MKLNTINSLLLDCGRKYFSLCDIKEIVNEMSDNGFSTLILAFGNDGLRFLLEDMEIMVFGYTYSSELVKEKIHQANLSYCDNGSDNELTQAEMEDLFDFCKKRNIDIIPLLNSPGHMNSILISMELLGLNDVRYKGSKTTINLDNCLALEFLTELVKKYIKWFNSKGCKYFHLGCDEYANDILQSGFSELQSPKDYKYGNFVDYVNALSKIVINNGMVPIIFNDGMYFGNAKSNQKINKNVIASYWTKGWEKYNLADVRKIIENGHFILNTNCNWYYVLGRFTKETESLDFTFDKAIHSIYTLSRDDIAGCGKYDSLGAVLCIWCDNPDVNFDEMEKNNIKTLIECFGKNLIK